MTKGINSMTLIFLVHPVLNEILLLTTPFYWNRMISGYSTLIEWSMLMKVKLFDSELKVMELLWEEGDTTAKRIAELAKERTGWSKTTTYTVIKKCIEKGAIKKLNPGYLCHALVTREDAQILETTDLINKMYNGRTDQLVATLLDHQKLTKEEIEHLKEIVERLQ